MSGCARIQHQADLESYPFYITVQRGYPPVRAVSFSNRDIDYKPLDKRIEEYLNSHQETRGEIAKNIKNYVISRGMDKEQVLTIVGKSPDCKDFSKQNEEKWIYGSVISQGRVVIISFKDDYVLSITDKYWDSSKK